MERFSVIREVLPEHTPNEGRVIWNNNDQMLQSQLQQLALNVRAAPYFAQGDGVADDYLALQTAINDCHATGGGYVFLPAGTYVVGASLLLRDGVSLLGASTYYTTIRLGDGIDQPVITDVAANTENNYAVGPVTLANFTIDGNKANNPAGQEGIFTSAYFSNFENLQIKDCRTHGIRIGQSRLANAASQNRIVGCRIRDCDDTGILLDIKAPDQLVSQNFVHDCAYGIVIKNGGVNVTHNVVYNHAFAGIQIKQTSYGGLIGTNDLNGNRQNGIHITRTSMLDERQWDMLLVLGNSISGNDLEADNSYDAILVETDVPNGIAKLSIIGNKIFTLGDPNRFRYGVHLAANILQSRCVANHITDVGTAPYFVGETCQDITLDSLHGSSIVAPSIPASAESLKNPFHAPVTCYITGGDVSAVAIDQQITGLTGGSFRLAPQQAITLTYSVPPTWTWIAD